MLVRGQSGALYRVQDHWLERLDGFGRARTRTCWRVTPLGQHPPQDALWAMALALQCDEARVLREFPWRP